MQRTPRLPPLNALRAFEAAARHSSFAVAADELCVTPGAVSRQIQLLEATLGIALFRRSNRRVALTEAGARYFTMVTGPFAELARATQMLHEESGRAPLCIDCVPTLAMHWLLPRLNDFRQRHPECELSIRTSVGPVDLTQAFDLAIRRNPAHFAGLAATPLGAERSLPVCSPAFARDHALRVPADVAHVTTIHIRAREDLWPAWCRAHGPAMARLAERLTIDHTFVAIQAAEDGLGLAMVPALFVERELAVGRLVAPLGDRTADSGTYFLLDPERPPRPEGEAFREWIKEGFSRA